MEEPLGYNRVGEPDRDFVGYGAEPPDPQWPGGARIAVNINVNFEGGGERSILEGDDVSEGALNDIGAPKEIISPLVQHLPKLWELMHYYGMTTLELNPIRMRRDGARLGEDHRRHQNRSCRLLRAVRQHPSLPERRRTLTP